MEIAWYVIFGLLGIVIGSFLGVVVFRLHTKRINKGRSMCDKCGHALQSHDLIPIFSFLLLRGRCRYCKLRMSWHHPLLEILTGAIFVLLYWKFSTTMNFFNIQTILLFVYYAFIFSVLIAMSVYDSKHFILPWRLMRIFLLATFLGPFVISFFNGGVSLSTITAGFITAFPFWLLWYFSKGKLIGFGDVELMCGFGFLLGISGGFAAIMLGFWAGAIYAFLHVLFNGRLIPGKTQIPFGPFLAMGCFVAFLFTVTLKSFMFGSW